MHASRQIVSRTLRYAQHRVHQEEHISNSHASDVIIAHSKNEEYPYGGMTKNEITLSVTTISIVVLILCFIMICLLCRRRKRTKFAEEDDPMTSVCLGRLGINNVPSYNVSSYYEVEEKEEEKEEGCENKSAAVVGTSDGEKTDSNESSWLSQISNRYTTNISKYDESSNGDDEPPNEKINIKTTSKGQNPSSVISAKDTRIRLSTAKLRRVNVLNAVEEEEKEDEEEKENKELLKKDSFVDVEIG